MSAHLLGKVVVDVLPLHISGLKSMDVSFKMRINEKHSLCSKLETQADSTLVAKNLAHSKLQEICLNVRNERKKSPSDEDTQM